MTAVSGCSGRGQMTAMQRPAGGSARRPITYARDIPLTIRNDICRMLDVSHAWINLAGRLGFSNDEVQSFKQALYRMAGSPTDEMLTVWDYGCHTITELYRKLFEMKHARCMMLLKDFVDPSLHHLIKEVQGVQPTDNDNDSASNVHQGHSQIPPVVYVPGAGGQPPYTADGPKSSQDSTATGGHQPHHRKPGQPQATQGSWNGGPDEHQAGSLAVKNQGRRSEGLTANMNKDSSEKVIGLGSPFQGWEGGSSSANNKSGNRGELISGGSDGIGSSQVMGEKERLENYQDQSALSLTIHIPYDDIVKATNNFNGTYRLGEGAFGTVYHAVINLTNYAVKRMKQNEHMGFETNKIARADQMKELRALVTYRNPYIVALCAFCFDGPSPCLVYEFMENGSLEDNLLCKAQRGPLDWRTRHRIAEGAALGINFLHKAQEKPLIHGDIKSANILLGKHMEPKIADFGLARFGPEDGKTYCYLKTKNAHGTLPYLPEEFKRSFKLSTKVDVFSFGVVLMEILAGERVSDSRREPNKLLTDIVEEAMELEKQQKGVIERIRDRRCPDWPWDIAWYLLDLALKCTRSKFTQRPEIVEAVNTLRDIAAEIARRDEMQKRREEYPVQDTKRRSPEGFQDQYYTPQPQRYSPPSHEASVRYASQTGPGGVPVRRDLSIESNTAVTRPGPVPDPRYEASYQRHPMQQTGMGYNQGRYPAPQGYGDPRLSYQQPGIRRHTSSETSDDNNLFSEDKLDFSSMSSSLTSYDMSRVGDPSMCQPLLYQSQSSVPSSVSYQHQQSNPYSPPVYDVRHPDPRQLYPSHQNPAGYHTQTSQGYPVSQQGGSQYQNPLCSSMVGNVSPYQDSRYQTTESSYYATQNPAVHSTSESQRRQESLTLQDHMRQLDISQLPTKPLGGPTQQDAPPKLPTDRPSQQPALVSAGIPRREPEQNTDIIPGYKPGMKEKSFKPPLVATISEESDEEATPLRTSLTTAEMQQYLAGKPREPSQQTEKMSESPAKVASAAPKENTTAATGEEASPLKSSLTTVQMRQYLPSKREPTEETEGESATNRLEEALVSASHHRDRSSPRPASATETPDTGPLGTSDDCMYEKSDLQSSLTTQQMRQFLPGRREPSQETETGPSVNDRTTVPPSQRSVEESEVCYSAPPNMAAPLAQRADFATRREPQQLTEPLNGSH
ncbi:serine/threonine-protein kinase par-1-like isoform X2 [Patiria miniata]|uniref:non-specific serine/threonine protein kinase n=1 Tax=Patiria miniata TaxID=46514 RepID=A0A914AVU9_PATMI|nr:serine/threonine-protein kinase par-1-like isoform X2 [Patiria miniata]